MDSTIPEGASTNPYKPYVEDLAGLAKNYEPTNYKGFGRYNWI